MSTMHPALFALAIMAWAVRALHDASGSPGPFVMSMAVMTGFSAGGLIQKHNHEQNCHSHNAQRWRGEHVSVLLRRSEHFFLLFLCFCSGRLIRSVWQFQGDWFCRGFAAVFIVAISGRKLALGQEMNSHYSFHTRRSPAEAPELCLNRFLHTRWQFNSKQIFYFLVLLGYH